MRVTALTRRQRALVRRGLYGWLVVRVTGLLLTVLVIGHFALTHIVTDVADTNSAYVAGRWASSLVIAWDWLMLGAAVLHGAIGLRTVIGDYSRPAARRALSWILVAVSVLMLGLGTWTIARAAIP